MGPPLRLKPPQLVMVPRARLMCRSPSKIRGGGAVCRCPWRCPWGQGLVLRLRWRVRGGGGLLSWKVVSTWWHHCRDRASEISMRMPVTWPGCMLAAAEVLCLLVPLLAGVPLGQGERCFDRIDILFG